MSQGPRPELSERNRYWIDRHRYYELKHFCLQYPIWRKNVSSLDGYGKCSRNRNILPGKREKNDPTAMFAIERAFYSDRIELINSIAVRADSDLASYILIGVTEGIPYDILKLRYGIPCSKDTYYDRYRRFFWLLSQERQ